MSYQEERSFALHVLLCCSALACSSSSDSAGFRYGHSSNASDCIPKSVADKHVEVTKVTAAPESSFLVHPTTDGEKFYFESRAEATLHVDSVLVAWDGSPVWTQTMPEFIEDIAIDSSNVYALTSKSIFRFSKDGSESKE